MTAAVGRANLYVGLAALALAVLILLQAWGTAFFVPGQGTAPMAFPLIIGLGFGAVGVLLVARALLGRDPGPTMDWPARGDALRLVGVIAALVLYIVLLERIGFVLANVVLGLLTLKLLAPYRWWAIALIAVLMAVGASLVFETFLGVNLPRGPISLMRR